MMSFLFADYNLSWRVWGRNELRFREWRHVMKTHGFFLSRSKTELE